MLDKLIILCNFHFTKYTTKNTKTAKCVIQSDLEADPNGVACLPYLDGLHHPGVSELPQYELLVELARSLATVGFDAAYEVWAGLFQCLHQCYE